MKPCMNARNTALTIALALTAVGALVVGVALAG